MAEAVLPPEGVEWADRWAELENAFASLEVERDSLLVEVTQLRRQRIDQAMTELSTASKASAIDSKELQELRLQLEEARRQSESRLEEVVAERGRNTKLSEELQKRIADLSALSSEKLQMQYEKNSADSALLPEKQARACLELEKAELERSAAELRGDLEARSEECRKLHRERTDERRELGQKLEVARADADFQKKEADEARDAQRRLMEQAAAAERKLKELREDFAAERANFEEKLHNRKEQLERMTALRDSVQEDLARLQHAKDDADKVQKNIEAENAKLKLEFANLQDQLKTAKSELEDVLQQRLPGSGAPGSLPEGFGSLAELVREATTAREEALRERHAREQLQEVLQEVEREVRSRYPALMSQRQENERLRVLSAQLTRQNEGLLAQVKELQTSQQAAEARAKRSERSEQILESHARDIAKQLAVVVHENRRLNGSLPSLTGVSELEALEADRRSFRTLQDLTEQNEALRKSVARLSGECETAAQQELQTVREEQEQQVEQWKKYLAEKAEQMKALADTVERITRERDEAKRALKKLEAAPEIPATPSLPVPSVASQGSSGKSGGTSSSRELGLLREQLAAVREEFVKNSERLYSENKELRESEMKARHQLASTQGHLEFETKRTGDLEVNLKQIEKTCENLKMKLKKQDERVESLEDRRKREELTLRDLEANISQLKRDKGQVEVQLKVEKSKVANLEQSNATLIAEKTSHSQLLVDIQARAANQNDAYKTMKDDLEAAYQREQVLLREQLQLSKTRQEDLQRSVTELCAARAARETEASEAKARVAELEVAAGKSEVKLAQCTEEIHALREAGSALPRRASEIAAEAKAQLERSQASWERGGSGGGQMDSNRLEQQLRMAEEREKEHGRSAEIWKSLLASHEADLKASKEEVSSLQAELKEVKSQQAVKDLEVEKVTSSQEELQAKLDKLTSETLELRGQLDVKAAEVEAAKLEIEKKDREVGGKLEAAKRASAENKDVEKKWEQSYRDLVALHATDIKELQEVRERLLELQRNSDELGRQRNSLLGEAERARHERSEELEALQKRLQSAEMHAEALGEENRKYQEHLLSLSDSKHFTGTDAEAIQQKVAAELRKARELGELQRRELELDRERLEREAKSLRVEAQELHERLDQEQKEVLRLQAETRLSERAATKLGQFELLEDEKRRLEAEVRSMEVKLDEAQKALESGKTQAEPLQRVLKEFQGKEELWERAKKALEAKADEWKQRYEETVVKFDAQDMKEFQNLKEESAKWVVQKKELNGQIEKLKDEMKQKNQAQTEIQAKTILDLNTKLQEASKARDTAQSLMKSKDEILTKQTSELKSSISLRQLHTKKISELEEELKKLDQEKKKLAAEASAQGSSKDITLKKIEADLKTANARADRALHLAMDYQRAVEALMAEAKRLENAKENEVGKLKQKEAEVQRALSELEKVRKEAADAAAAAAAAAATAKEASKPQLPSASAVEAAASGVKRKVETPSPVVGQATGSSTASTEAVNPSPVAKSQRISEGSAATTAAAQSTPVPAGTVGQSGATNVPGGAASSTSTADLSAGGSPVEVIVDDSMEADQAAAASTT